MAVYDRKVLELPVRIYMLTPVHCQKCLVHEHQTCMLHGVREENVWSVESCFCLHHVDVWVCAPLTRGGDGTRVHYEKETTRKRKCDDLGNVLLGFWCSFEYYFNMHSLPKYYCRLSSPLYGTRMAVGSFSR